jgi:histidine ammonia-lyase
MRNFRLLPSIVSFYLLLSGTALADITLNGHDATPELIVRVANGEAVAVGAESLEKVARAWQLRRQPDTH